MAGALRPCRLETLAAAIDQVLARDVYKSDTPTDYNVKFMWVLDANGNQYPGWPLDVGDNQDFLAKAYVFELTPDSAQTYRLNVAESRA